MQISIWSIHLHIYYIVCYYLVRKLENSVLEIFSNRRRCRRIFLKALYIIKIILYTSQSKLQFNSGKKFIIHFISNFQQLRKINDHVSCSLRSPVYKKFHLYSTKFILKYWEQRNWITQVKTTIEQFIPIISNIYDFFCVV